MGVYPYHPIKIEKNEEPGSLHYKITANLFDDYMRMIDRKIEEQGEAAMNAALEAHGYTKERIIRCKDCKQFAVDNSDHDYRSGWWCHRWDTDRVAPDGFCAWAKTNLIGDIHGTQENRMG